MGCIDLRPWAESHRYRWRWEAEQRESDAFYVEIPCRHGMIYPYGGETLLAYASRGVKRHIAALPGASHHQYDDDAQVFRVPVERLDDVAAILKPRRRRTYTPEHRAVLRERLKSLRERRQNGLKTTQAGD